ncbi:hypothetical protein AH4AK4_1063 [Aeromonas hydrophila 4AK4]|nr:hypothetical protein AH4AK4_1063 [Aeromonas hydrophila 4AK4]
MDLIQDLIDPLFDAGFGLVVLVGVIEGQADDKMMAIVAPHPRDHRTCKLPESEQLVDLA